MTSGQASERASHLCAGAVVETASVALAVLLLAHIGQAMALEVLEEGLVLVLVLVQCCAVEVRHPH